MNVFDLIVALVFVWALFDGWRRGFVLQLCSLAGLVAGIWLAVRYGALAGWWLRLDPSIASAGGFAAVLVAAMIAVGLCGMAVRTLFRLVGFGLPDRLLGVAVAVVKYGLLLSLLFSAFDRIDEERVLVGRETIDGSKYYRPVAGLADRVFPLVKRALQNREEDGSGEER